MIKSNLLGELKVSTGVLPKKKNKNEHFNEVYKSIKAAIVNLPMVGTKLCFYNKSH